MNKTKTISLNLATAFVLRKRIKELANKLEAELQFIPYIQEKEMVTDTLDRLTCKDVEKQLDYISCCLNAIRDLSNIIDENNLEGKTVLNELNQINREIFILKHIEHSLSGNKTSKSRNPITGVWEVNTLEKITNINVTGRLQVLNQRKIRCEDKLAKINSGSTFSFTINEGIYNTIYGE